MTACLVMYFCVKQADSHRTDFCGTAYYEFLHKCLHRGADKSLARAGRKQATATEDSEFHISYL